MTSLPCIMLRMPMSSSRMSSVAATWVADCKLATMANFCTTFSSSFISLELSMSASGSSSTPSTSWLNLKTFAAISLTVPSMRSSGRTASSVTTLERARLLKIMMKMMKTMVSRAIQDFRTMVLCMSKDTMKLSVCTLNEEAARAGPTRLGVQAPIWAVVASSSQSKELRPLASVAGTPMQAVKGPKSELAKKASMNPNSTTASCTRLSSKFVDMRSTHACKE
mmetsp:Transcript_34038/g.86108  ORF Transcript_34038/g.86108 Transcript_34038/m.86108 type:complete len:223 (+) Transcript_34038:1382-2050(+)